MTAKSLQFNRIYIHVPVEHKLDFKVSALIPRKHEYRIQGCTPGLILYISTYGAYFH